MSGGRPVGRCRKASGKQKLEFFPRALTGAQAVLFHFPIEGQGFVAVFREFCPTPGLSAASGLHKRFHGLDERPGFHVGHFHAPGGFADRAGFFQQSQ